MTGQDPIKTARDGVALVGEVLKAAGDNPNVKAAGDELGKSALTITKTINNALLPLAAVNFGFEKARQYFAQEFLSDMAEKAGEIPKERLIDPKPSVAGPALQGLAFSHEEASLKEMYLNLLKSSMDQVTAESTHPAFAEIIKQMSAEEAELVALLLAPAALCPIVEIRRTEMKDASWRVLRRHVLPAPENPRVSVIVDNCVRLGLIEVDYNKHLAGSDAYDWVDELRELKTLRAALETEEVEVTIEKGVLTPTSFGAQFAAAVGILDGEADQQREGKT